MFFLLVPTITSSFRPLLAPDTSALALRWHLSPDRIANNIAPLAPAPMNLRLKRALYPSLILCALHPTNLSGGPACLGPEFIAYRLLLLVLPGIYMPQAARASAPPDSPPKIHCYHPRASLFAGSLSGSHALAISRPHARYPPARTFDIRRPQACYSRPCSCPRYPLHTRSMAVARALNGRRPCARYPLPARLISAPCALVAGRPGLNPRCPSPAWALDTRPMHPDGHRLRSLPAAPVIDPCPVRAHCPAFPA
ncbi:hypothetical protein B0H14DRAFT_3473691 [Mycena olivaceomarginata]|nr:hypothetical protein B0H14DRAFT_3473691 [Mycena olivaceomarginata]